MGRFLGHSATGTFFYVLGLFYYLRSIDLRLMQKLRSHWFAVSFIGLSMFFGGIIYTIGEITLMITQIGSWQMSTTQHVIMSTTFSLSGLLILLHIWRKLQGDGWLLIEPLLWFILFVLWYFHPQDNDYFSFGHVSIGVMFLMVSAGRLIEIGIARYSNKQHHFNISYNQYKAERNNNGFRESVWASSPLPRDAQLNSVYTNPMVYSTPLPLLNGFMLMLIGTWDWDMAVHFYKGDENNSDLTFMIAEETWIIHLLVNLIVTVLFHYIAKIIDYRIYGHDDRSITDLDRFRTFNDKNDINKSKQQFLSTNNNLTESTRDLIDNSDSDALSLEDV